MSSIQELLKTIERLRDKENGCPWDIKQTMDTIVPGAIEEVYEVADAIARKDIEDIRAELGDLLLQVVFLSQIAREEGLFEFADVAATVNEKMLRRHPHIFGDASNVSSAEEQLERWERIKKGERDEKGHTSILDDVPQTLPSLLRAEKLQKRCKNHGFDWDNIQDVEAKVREEIQEVSAEIHAEPINQELVEEEIGDLFFAAVNLARHAKVKPEMALQKANRKFERRFRAVEAAIEAKGKTLDQCSLSEMDLEWNRIKEIEKTDK